MKEDLIHVLKAFGLWTLGQVVYGALIVFVVSNYYPNASVEVLAVVVAAPYVLLIGAAIVHAAVTDKWFSRR